MDTIVKAAAAVAPGADDEQSPHGSFRVILSTPATDRDGEQVKSDEWVTPLPKRIPFDVDHGMSVQSTVGSGVPSLDAQGRLIVEGTYASTPLAQTTRALVKEGHITSTSVAFLRHDTGKDARVRRELLNGAFVAVPANPEALVLSSKTMSDLRQALQLVEKVGARNSAGDLEHLQAAHDAIVAAGAVCPAANTNTSNGNGKTLATRAAVSDKPWSDFPNSAFSDEQYARSCVLDRGPDAGTAKDRYSLPIREPDGTLNRNAVHAAAAALSGGRGGVNAPGDAKAKAARALVTAYGQLGEDPPQALTAMAKRYKAAADPAADDSPDPASIATALDAALDQAMPLLQSAADAADALLDSLGVPDPDDDDDDAAPADSQTAPSAAATAPGTPVAATTAGHAARLRAVHAAALRGMRDTH